MKYVIQGILSVLLFISSIAFAKDRVLFDEAYKPYMYRDAATQELKGAYPALLREVFKQITVAADFEALPWKRVVAEGQSGQAGIGGIYFNKEREKIFDYSQPILTESMFIYYQSSKDFKPETLADLKGKKVGINAGWSYGDDFDKMVKDNVFTVEAAKSNTENLMKLNTQRIDTFIADGLSVDLLLKTLPDVKKVVKSTKPVLENKGYIVFAKSMNKKELLAQIDAKVAEMQNSGEYQAIIAKALSEE